MDAFAKKDLNKKSDNLSDWYTDVVLKAGLAEYGPVRGTMVIRPYGFAIWERTREILDGMFKKDSVENAYFPLFIPYSLLQKEKEHVEGFSPELALVTVGGGEKLKDPLVVRPTSETVMYEMYKKWIASWRDLPLKINQWNNVVRWEKRTYLFLRTLEFLWQEGHCAHATHEESREMVDRALNWYRQVFEDYFAIPVVYGIKSESEKFAGAYATFAIEALMPDGKALQAATSHDLGQNFSKAQDITFQDKAGKTEFVWQNSWGFSTRTLGALFLVHGDDNGLVLPPKIAPIKVAIIPIVGKKDVDILKYCEKVKLEIEKEEKDSLFPGRVEIFKDSEKSYGRRVNDVELKGIPVKIAIGTRELEEKTVAIGSRIDRSFSALARIGSVSEKVESTLIDIQKEMLKKASEFLEKNTHEVGTYDEFKNIMKTTRGLIKTFWCEDKVCEEKIKTETKATTRVKVSEEKSVSGKCVYCGKSTSSVWCFAQAY